MLEAAGEALVSLLTVQSLALLVLGTVIGTMVAIIPGLGSPVALAVLLPVTFSMEPAAALTFLVPLIGAGGFAGSMTAILTGVPGDETNAATTLDGYALAQQGRAGEAIGASATSSVLGALFGVLVLVVSIPFLRGLILQVGPPEIFAVTLLGILMVGAVSARGDRNKGIASGFLGIALGLIGFNYALGGVRFTVGIGQLDQGIPVVAALVGLFAVPEAVIMLRGTAPISASSLVRGGVSRGVLAVLRRPRLLLQSSMLGTGIGMVPGVGGSVACWASYFAAQRTSRNRSEFGRGAIEGVIGPEATIDAKDGGQLMPLLALGVPGGLSTAILAGAFLFHGIEPGPTMFSTQLPLVYLMVFALIFSNVVTSLLGLSMANVMIRVTVLPSYIIAPLIVALGLVGSYVATTSFYGPVIFLVFGGLGYLLTQGGYSRAAVVVGIILIPLIETNLHISLQSYRGELTFLLRPGVLAVLLAGVLAFGLPAALRSLRHRLKRPAITQVALDDRVGRVDTGDIDGELDPDTRSDTQKGDYSKSADFAVGAISALVGSMMLARALTLPADQRLIPILALPVLIVAGLVAIVRALRRPQLLSRERGTGRRDILTAGWIAVLPVLMWVAGLFAAVFLWSAVIMAGYELHGGKLRRNRLVGLVAIAAALAVGLYLLVVGLLGVRTPDGILI